MLTQKSAAVTLTYGVCAWADGNTAAAVGKVDRSVRDPADVDLEEAARTTLRIRSEMLRPAADPALSRRAPPASPRARSGPPCRRR
ncbi:hypothetical protein ACFQ3Z_31055 [Streptomyces nogalater]